MGQDSQQEQRKFKLTPLELAILLFHVETGADLKESVGFEDANRTLGQLEQQVNQRQINIDRDLLESMLWSANLMDEIGLFYHPKHIGFYEFVMNLLNSRRKSERHYKFNRMYNKIYFKE